MAEIAQQGAKKRVMVVDDELGPTRFSQLHEELQKELRDPNSPTLELGWSIAQANRQVGPLEDATVNERMQTARSEQFLNEVVLGAEFFDRAGEPLKNWVVDTKDRKERSAKVLKVAREAFPDNAFEIVVHTKRPEDLAALLDLDFLIIDLVMADETVDPVSAAREFLRGLGSKETATASLPPILLVSNLAERLESHRFDLRAEAEVSATGLCVMSKQRVSSEGFGAEGLKLLWDRMSAERSAAREMRELGVHFEKAILEALANAKRTLWNLDAAALQRVHHTASKENDPFVDHLLELLSREHEWHIESNESLRAAVIGLGTLFDNEIVGEGAKKTVRKSFRTHDNADMRALRSLEQHYWWMPDGATPPTKTFLPSKHSNELGRFLPFGTVARHKNYGQDEYYIHLTQPCDLIKEDTYRSNRSFLFACAAAYKSKADAPKGSIVIPGHKLPEGYNYLAVRSDQTTAYRCRYAMARCLHPDLEIVGRLRVHVARQLLNAVTDWLTRLDAFTLTRQRVVSASVYLVQENAEIQTYERAVPLVSFDDNNWHVLDEEQLLIPLWSKQKVGETANIDAEVVARFLDAGLRATKTIEAGPLGLQLWFEEDAPAVAKAVNAKKGKPRLVFVGPPL